MRNLSIRACRTEREFEKMVDHARKFRADAIVIIMPARIEIDISEVVERLEAVARSQNSAVLIVESFTTEVFNDLVSGWWVTDGACV
jgi:dihydrodipicolinate synthase/N-acetylneuraminate lyase